MCAGMAAEWRRMLSLHCNKHFGPCMEQGIKKQKIGWTAFRQRGVMLKMYGLAHKENEESCL